MCVIREKSVSFYSKIEILSVTLLLARLPSFAWKINFRYQSEPTQLRTIKPATEFSDQNLKQIGQGVHEL